MNRKYIIRINGLYAADVLTPHCQPSPSQENLQDQKPCCFLMGVQSAEIKLINQFLYIICGFEKVIIILLALTLLLIFPKLTYSSEADCGSLYGGGIGPLDYNDLALRGPGKPLDQVEGAHFTAEVEGLIRGRSGYLWSELDYTLRAFPNHPRALYAFARYDIRERKKAQLEKKTYAPPRSRYNFPATAECYFDRAIRWRPNDPNVRLVYGIYLQLIGNLNNALEQYKFSEKLQPNSADLQYNLGLLYFEKKEYALAKKHAQKAYQLGYPLPGLRDKLKRVGYW